MNPNEVDKFFSDLPTEDKKIADVFEEGTEKPAIVPEKGTDGELENEGRKNRRHRRLEEQLQKERESNIALNERIKVLSEFDKFSKETGGELDPRLIQAFGVSEEGKQAARLFAEVLKEGTIKAKEEALQEFEQKQVQVQREQKEFETFIDSELEALEDEYNVDLTSDAPAARKARTQFLELVQKVSPKDDNGIITGYADFGSTFELYQEKQGKDKGSESSSRQKEIAARSMQKSGQSDPASTQTFTPGFRGWEKDFNLG